MRSVPFPMDHETYIGNNDEYTQIDLEYPYMATTQSTYTPLLEQQLRSCTKIRSTYYCENAHLLRDRNTHICASAVFYDAAAHDIVNACKMKYIKSQNIKPDVLDAGDTLILSNLPSPWTLVCEPNKKAIPIVPTTYRILNRTELCECSLTAGPYFLAQTKESCTATSSATDGIFHSYYAINKLVFDVLKQDYKIEPSEQMTSLFGDFLQNIPRYSWNTLPWYKNEEDEQKRIAQNWENDRVEADLQQIMEVLVEDTDELIYRSKEDWNNAQKDFVRYMKAARFWEKLSIIGSFVSYLLLILFIIMLFTCKSTITKAIMALPINDQYEFVRAPQTYAYPLRNGKSDSDLIHTDPPYELFTLPRLETIEPPAESLSSAQTASTVVGFIWVIMLIIFIAYHLYKKFRYKSGVWNVCFPVYPMSKIIRGNARTDIFVEVINTLTNEVVWAQFRSVTVPPSRLRLQGRLNRQDVHVQPGGCCCCKELQVNWNNVLITTDEMTTIAMPPAAKISVFTPSNLIIDTDNAIQINIYASMLDQAFPIPPMPTNGACAGPITSLSPGKIVPMSSQTHETQM